MAQIDLQGILSYAHPSSYSNLVTRTTGRAVRGLVEEKLQQIDPGQLAIIDFSSVNCMDFSCADEIVAKLLLSYGTGRYFLLKGVSAAHTEAIEAVLERHGLATVAEDRSGHVKLLGPITEIARQAFGIVMETGSAREQDLVENLNCSPACVREALNELCSQHLIRFAAPEYQPLTTV